MSLDVGATRSLLARMERGYRRRGLRPVRWVLPRRSGCRVCRDRMKGPWIISLMAVVVPELKEALLFVVTLCRRCHGNEDRRDEVADKAAAAYLTSRRAS